MVAELEEFKVTNGIEYEKVQDVESKLDDLIDAIGSLHITDEKLMGVLGEMSEVMHLKRLNYDRALLKSMHASYNKNKKEGRFNTSW